MFVGDAVGFKEKGIEVSSVISKISDPMEVSGKTPSNINCIPSESGVEKICLLSTIPSKENLFCTKGKVISTYHVGTLNPFKVLKSHLMKENGIRSNKNHIDNFL